MQVHVFRREDTAWNRPFFYFLMSDLHIGHVACRQKLIAAELAAARAAGARILINGDVFDAINPKDKRFALSQIAKPLRGEDDMEAAAVGMAVKLLGPYADLIDLIGVGNHEEAWIRRSAADMVGRLIRELHAGLKAQGIAHTIRHGGISGFIRTYLSYDTDAPLARNSTVPRALTHTLAYHHGSGGDAPITKGQIEFSRKVAHVIADAYWMGHKHNKTFSEDCILDLSTKNQIKYRQRLNIQTASYLENWKATDQGNPLGYTYAESSNSPPKPLGGLWLALTPRQAKQPDGRTRRWVEQAVSTSAPMSLPIAI
jgi:UDP-2,3-diacylglucosamine pyrophosphatase LpxH